MSTLSFRRALNLRRHSTVSCLCIMDATVERCCRTKQELNTSQTVSIVNFYLFENNLLLEGYNIVILSVVLCEYVQIYLRTRIIVLGGWVNTYADPRMFEGLFSSDSLGWVNGQHLIDQVLSLWSHCVPLGGWELRKIEKQVGLTVG